VNELQAGDPRQVGTYRLLGRLGAGGMGTVYLGQSPGGRLVAVKVIRAELASSPEFRVRFAREVTAARRVSGIFTTPVVDADPDAPEPWLVTGYVDGPSLADHVERQGALTGVQARSLALGLAEGLAAIHDAGVVHRDLKPSNVLLAEDGPRIIDFGISRAVDATAITRTGLVVGSPGFMSPEQALGRPVGPASDIFSLGAVLAYAATGGEPFGTGEPAVLLYRVVHDTPALAGVPGWLRPVVDSCMARDPARRPGPRDLLGQLSGIGPAASPPAASPPAASRPATSAAASRPATSPPADTAAPASRREPPAAPTGTAIDLQPVPGPGRRSRLSWPTLTKGIVLVGAAVAISLPVYHSLAAPPRHPAPPPARVASPAAVVESFISAINAHNWRHVWLLGGMNLSSSYSSLVAGFRYTRHDRVVSLTTAGDIVTAQVSAVETTGAVQTYRLVYTVRGGKIVAGHQTLLSG
jgi:serine/threonine protein kinase